MRRALVREELAAAPLADLETFSEFTENPTFSGFLAQAAKGTGQVVPSAITSISGAGIGALGARFALKGAAKKTAERVVQDSRSGLLRAQRQLQKRN